ncbi:unnamed protein product [Adineta steineri]|uniref:Nucleoprotein TPR n=1 Tax=Adineta steineri TaxID=433720 RepID=A0A813NCQ1_9BILA|nr:unnamed protein product [Adineta steineri]CAF0768962.1 unnamed protein product [Adineta steineri]
MRINIIFIYLSEDLFILIKQKIVCYFKKFLPDIEQTIRRLQDELDNTTQLLESIRSKGADLTQLTNFLDGTLSHIRSSDPLSSSSTTTSTTTTICPECRQLKSALVLELTGKERFRFGYEQLSSMIKEAAPILRRQKQDYEASFEVIGKLTSELNEARKELSELHQLSGESIENYRYIQRENQFLVNDNKSLATKIQVLLSEIEELRTGKRLSERETSSEHDPNQQVPLTFRNVVELQHVNQKLDKLVREMRAQTNADDEDLNRTRFDELKKEHQQQQEKLKETKNQLDALETQMLSLIQERDFLRLLVSRSSSSQSTSSTSPTVDIHQVENLRDQVNRLQEKIEVLTKKNTQIINEKDDLIRTSNEKVRSIQYELLTARTEVEQTNEKLNLINDEHATNRLTIASLRTEIHGWQERHNMLAQIRTKQEQQYFHVLTELRQLKDEKATLECRLNTSENEHKFDSIKFEQIENECMLLKSEIIKNEQIQPVIEKLQNLAEYTKERTKAMFEAKLNDLTAQNNELRQRIEQHERDKELMERTNQSRLDEITQNLQQEKLNHTETRAKFVSEKEKAEQIQRQLKEIESKVNSNTNQKSDFEQQLGNYEKELKMLRLQLDAANNDLEIKQTLIQSGVDNANESNINGQKAIEELDKLKQEYTQKSYDYESEIDRLKQEVLNHQSIINQNEENVRSLNERIQAMNDQYQIDLTQSTERYDQILMEKNEILQQLQNAEQSLNENMELKEKINQFESTIEEQQMNFDELKTRYNELSQQTATLQTDNERLFEQIQQYETTILQKDDLFKVQQDITQQIEQRYAELEQKHNEQHTLMIKLSTHLAAKESETLAPTTDSSVNETWNTILAMNNYLRVENTRLTEDVERIRLENAHLNERNNTLEQTYLNDQQIIDELNVKNQSLQILQDRFDNDQQQINNLQEKCQSYEQAKQNMQQENYTFQTTIEQLNQQKQLLNNQIKQSEDKSRTNEEQVTVKTAEIERQGREMEDLRGNIKKLESDNQELKQMTTKLRSIAIKYRSNAAAVAAAATNAPTTASTTPADTDELLAPGSTEVTPGVVAPPEANKNRPLPNDLSEKMNKLRDALVAARTIITSQQTRMTQMTNELTRAKQARISTDLTEIHSLVDNIRQTYDTEINDLKHIIQLFDNTDPNEHMAEIVRLRKKIDELTANKPSTSSNLNTSSNNKQSEDVTPKPTRPQAFAAPMTQEPAISRVAPMAPLTGRQIGVAIPMTASATPTTTSTPLWTNTASTTAETTTSQAAASVEHPTTTQISTPAGVNLLMKRTRTDDNDHKSTESTLKRTKAETETNPLIAHVEPQVREQQQQQQQQIPSQEQQQQQETMESNVIDTTRTDIIPIQIDNEGIRGSVEETTSLDQSMEGESRLNITNTSSTNLDSTTTTTNESTNITMEQSNDQRRDILPIVYDVQSIPTINTGGPPQINRGGVGRSRPFSSVPGTRRPWPARGGGVGSGRGGIGGRGAGGAGGVGPSARQ